MKISQQARKLAKDLELNEADAAIMELKSLLYERAAQAIQHSGDSHEAIATKLGTSRARITRISNRGENSISLDLLLKIIVVLEKKIPFRLVAA